jgi:hypothetical protein
MPDLPLQNFGLANPHRTNVGYHAHVANQQLPAPAILFHAHHPIRVARISIPCISLHLSTSHTGTDLIPRHVCAPEELLLEQLILVDAPPVAVVPLTGRGVRQR